MQDVKELLERAEIFLARVNPYYDGMNRWSFDLIHDLANHIKGDGWQDIASAPKEGTQILAYDDDDIICVIRWGKHNHIPLFGWIRQVELYGEEVDGFDAIGWQPLPSPPTDNKE